MATYKRRRTFTSTRAAKRRKVYKKARGTYKRRATRYLRRRSFRTPRVSGTIAQIFPARRVMSHTYTCTYPLNVTVASPASIAPYPLLKVNSMYDPWTGVTGVWNVTPSMYTLMSTYYKHYSVLGVKATVVVRNTSQFNLPAVNPTASGTGGGSVYSAVNIPAMRWGCFLDENGGTTIADYPSFEPLRFHKYSHMQPTPFTAPSCKFTIGYSPKKFFGLKWDEPSVGSNTGADPSKLCNLVIYGQPLDMATVPVLGTFMINVRLKMKVMWTIPLDVDSGQGS